MGGLSSLLVQDQILNVTQIEKVLQRQVILGGDLSTIILEMGLLDESVLVDYMGRVLQMEPVEGDPVGWLDPELLARLDGPTAARLQVVPLVNGTGEKVLGVAGPLQNAFESDLAQIFGETLPLRLVLPVRLALLLDRAYGIPVPGRLRPLQKKLDPDHQSGPIMTPPGQTSMTPLSADDNSAVAVVERQETGGREETTRIFSQGEGSKRSEQKVGMNSTDATEQGMPTLAVSPKTDQPPATEPMNVKSRRPALINYKEACRRLDKATDRDEIIDLFFKFSHQAFDFSMLAQVIGESAAGRVMANRGEAPRSAAHISVSFDDGGLFARVAENGQSEIGPMDDLGGLAVLSQLRRDVPVDGVVIPVVLKGRPILLLYGESGQKGVRRNRVIKIEEFANKVARAFERLVLRKKYAQFKAVTPNEAPQTRFDRKQAISVESGNVSGSTKPDLAAFATVEQTQIVDEPASQIVDEPAPSVDPMPDKTSVKSTAGRSVSRSPRESSVSQMAPVQVVSNRHSVPSSAPLTVPTDDTGHRDAMVPDGDVVTDGHPPKAVLVSPVSVVAGVNPSPRFNPNHGVGTYMHVDKAARTSRSPSPPPEESSRKTADYTAALSGTQKYPISQDVRSAAIRSQTTAPEPIPLRPSSRPPLGGAPIPLQQTGRGGEVDEVSAMVDRLLAGNEDDQLLDTLRQHGEVAIGQLIVHFPGPLRCDRYQTMGRLPRVSFHGPVLRALVKFGRQVVPYVLPLLDSFDSEIRFYATFLFSEIDDEQTVPALVPRLFDNDRQIRAIAVDLVRRVQGLEPFEEVILQVCAVLRGSNTTLEKKRIAAEVLGDLRDASAILPLIGMLGSVDGVLAERCQRALVRITFNDFAFSEKRWRDWFENNQAGHPLLWAIEGINHKSEEIRRLAIEAVQSQLNDKIALPRPPFDFKQRKELYNRAMAYWQQEKDRLLDRQSQMSLRRH